MNTRSLLNLGLLVLLAALVILAIYEPGMAPPPAPPPLTGRSADEVKTIRIGKADISRMMFRKEDQRWRMTEPMQVPADPTRLSSLLRILSAPSLGRFSVSPGDLAKFQLDKPQAWLEIDDLHIDFGNTDPVNRRRYILIGTDLHLVDDLFYYHLVTDAMSYVATDLLPGNPAPVELRLPGLHLVQQDNGAWQVNGKSPASMDAVNALVMQWQHGRAQRVSRFEQQAAGGSPVLIRLAGGEVRFTLFEDDREVRLVREDLELVYHLPRENLAALFSLDTAATTSVTDR